MRMMTWWPRQMDNDGQVGTVKFGANLPMYHHERIKLVKTPCFEDLDLYKQVVLKQRGLLDGQLRRSYWCEQVVKCQKAQQHNMIYYHVLLDSKNLFGSKWPYYQISKHIKQRNLIQGGQKTRLLLLSSNLHWSPTALQVLAGHAWYYTDLSKGAAWDGVLKRPRTHWWWGQSGELGW